MINFFIHFSFIFSIVFWIISLIILILGPNTIQSIIEGIDTLFISISFMIFCFMLSNNVIFDTLTHVYCSFCLYANLMITHPLYMIGNAQFLHQRQVVLKH